jgi:hypothetical protein
LLRPGIDDFLGQLRSGKWNQTEPRAVFDPKIPASQLDAIRKANETDRASVENVFSREDLIAGVSLLNTILDNANPSAKLYFVRNGNYLFGYALEKFKTLQLGKDTTASN